MIRSSLSKVFCINQRKNVRLTNRLFSLQDGVLTIEAPLPAIAAGEKLIPIAQN